MFKSYRIWLAAAWLWGYASLAAAVSSAPLQAINSYIQNSGNCSERVVEWDKEYGEKAVNGETSRDFYYRVLDFLDWGQCGKPFFRPVISELRKVWIIYARGKVSEAEFEAKEAELVNLLFAAMKDEARGAQMVRAYQARMTSRLINLDMPKQYTNCTFFGDKPGCMD